MSWQSAVKATSRELIEEQLNAGANITFAISTHSMIPTLLPGDQLVVRHADLSSLELGEIVLLNTGSEWLAHRVIELHNEKGEQKLFTKGDNCPTADTLMSSASVAGIAIAVRRQGNLHSLVSGRAKFFGQLIGQLSRAQKMISPSTTGLLNETLAVVFRILVRTIAFLQ